MKDRVRYPKEVEKRTGFDRRRNGIPLPARTTSDLQDELDRFGIAMWLDQDALLRPLFD